MQDKASNYRYTQNKIVKMQLNDWNRSASIFTNRYSQLQKSGKYLSTSFSEYVNPANIMFVIGGFESYYEKTELTSTTECEIHTRLNGEFE